VIIKIDLVIHFIYPTIVYLTIGETHLVIMFNGTKVLYSVLIFFIITCDNASNKLSIGASLFCFFSLEKSIIIFIQREPNYIL